MSPLTCSLLALAATLTVANGSSCNSETFGDVTGRTVTLKTVYTPPGGGRVTTEDGCPSQFHGYVQVGETVQACNNDDSGVGPDIQEVNPPDFSPVDVLCSDGCRTGAKIDITQYCAP